MRLLEVTRDDGLQMAHIITSLRLARFDGISGEDMDKLFQAKRWLQSLAIQMAEQLREDTKPREVEATSPMRIKQMGPIEAKSRKKK